MSDIFEPNGKDPVPLGGAVDLDALRRRPEAQAAIAEALRRMLADQGFICACGELIRDQGVEFWASIEAPADGHMQVGIGATTFHSRECPALQEILSADLPAGAPRPLLLRAAPQIEWLDETVHQEASE